MNNKEYWKELKDREIVEILDGDTKLVELNASPQILHLQMPHLTAKDIVFGIGKDHFNYYIPLCENKMTRSRWQLFFDLLDKSIENDQVRELIRFIFNKKNFRKYIENELGLDISACRELIPQIQKAAISRINDILYTKDLKMTLDYDLVSLTSETLSKNDNEERKSNFSDTKEGFYILPFDDGGPEDMMAAIKEKLSDTDVKLRLVKAGDFFDKKYKTNIIAEIKDKIQNADVIIADLSEKNPNVYFELGIATALNKDIVTICNQENFDNKEVYNGRLPLDITINRIIFYKDGYKIIKKTAEKVVKEIESILTSTPVAVE